MTKQIRDYVLEARLIRESKEQKNEGKQQITRKDFEKLIKILTDTLRKIRTNKFPEAAFEINKVVNTSYYPYRLKFERCLVIEGESDKVLRDSRIIQNMLVDAAKQAGYDFNKFQGDELTYAIGNSSYSHILKIGYICYPPYSRGFVGFAINNEAVHTLESSQKNEEKEFTIKLVTPFGKAKVCSWKANSVDAAVKEFLDANPAYRENKKGAVIAESISDDIVREVKEEVKDGVKDFVQQDVDAKLNGEVTPADYQATYGEDIDDDSDSIFGDELDNVEPDEPEQTNESIDEASLKNFLKSEYDRAISNAKSYAKSSLDNFSSYYDGYAEAIKTIQKKFGL